MSRDRGVGFRVLGPVEVVVDSGVVPLGSAQLRAVLAALLVHANQVVSADRLVEIVWAGESPDRAVSAVQKLVYRLRTLLGSGRPQSTEGQVVVTRAPGYLVGVDAESYDAARFEGLVSDARGVMRGGDTVGALALLDEALGLWRGPAFAEFAFEEFARAEAARLEELRLVAVEERVEARLALGDHEELVGELDALVAECPYRERLWGELMLALYRAGRQAEALRAYGRVRDLLGEELGIEPGAALRSLEEAILLQKPELDWVPITARPPAEAGLVARGVMPSGTVTFLFTDVEGSTRLWDQHPEAMKDALARHDEILRGAVTTHGGSVVKTTGDGVHAAFATAHDALDAAAEAQRALTGESWAVTGPLRVRMGVHAGEAEYRDGDYYGPAVNRAARLMAATHGDQVVVSLATKELVRDTLPEGVALVDLGEHRLSDLSRAERVFQVVGPGLTNEFPPLRSLDAFPGNLPSQLTSFVGRDHELAAIAAALHASRLVTLTGVGGVGKTRLALQVAAEVVAEYADGAWLCELAPLRDPHVVVDAVAALFGLRAREGRTVAGTVVELLRAKRLMLVLDNCEHLLDPVVELVRMLGRECPGLVVLATSREGLGITGERMVAVGSLGAPQPDAPLEAVADSEAVRLFVDRATAVEADFEVTAENASAVVEVCQRLDGIPLALELAAARMSVLSPAELARRLGQRFRALAGGGRGVIERHATLRAAIDWSYDLLDTTEQPTFARLAVFAGGCTLEAAEAVTTGAGVDNDAMLDLLAALVARSLVVVDHDAPETRYQLLETIREYAMERLAEMGDADRVRREHAGYYATFAETAVPALGGPNQVSWAIRLDRELDNLRAALHWAIDAADARIALRLLSLSAAPAPAFASGFNRTVDAFAEAVLAIPGASAHPKFPAGLAAAAWLAYNRGDLELAARHCDDALEAERRLGTQPPLSYPWVVRANLAMAEAHMDETIEHWERAVGIMRANDDLGVAAPLAFLATIRSAAGNPAAAIPEAEEALTLARRFGAPSILAIALVAAGSALADSDPQRALPLIREAVDLEDSLGHHGAEKALIIAASLASRHGTRREALDLYAKVIDRSHATSGRPSLVFALGAVGNLLATGEPEAAAVLLGATDALASGRRQLWERGEERRHAIATLTATLGEARLTELRARGAAMGDDEAVAYARAAVSRALKE